MCDIPLILLNLLMFCLDMYNIVSQYIWLNKMRYPSQLKMKKPEKCKFIRNHSFFSAFKKGMVTSDSDEAVQSNASDGEESDGEESGGNASDGESDDDEVLAVIESDKSESEEEGEEREEEIQEGDDQGNSNTDTNEDIIDFFCTTRSGRTAMTWKASNYY